ncbi:MAG: hypothetical protein PVH41_19245, partial [Anaerolineae bacterium]
MAQRSGYESVISILGAFAIATALIGLLALGAAWLIGSPALVSASPADPTPTAVVGEQPDAPTDSVPTATPVPPTPVMPAVSPTVTAVGPVTATEIA